MGKTKSIGNSSLVAAGIVLAVMITAGVLLIRPDQTRASTEDKPQLLLEADVEGGIYLIGQTITLTATLDSGEIIGGIEYAPAPSFQAQEKSYTCSARALVSWNPDPAAWIYSNQLPLVVMEFNKPTVSVRLNIDDYDNVHPLQRIVIGYVVTGAWPKDHNAKYFPDEKFTLINSESEDCYVILNFSDDLGYHHEIESEDHIEVTRNRDAKRYFSVQLTAAEEESGSVNSNNGYHLEGSIIYALAEPKKYYKFLAWRNQGAYPALREQVVSGDIEDTAIFYIDPNDPPPPPPEEEDK